MPAITRRDLLNEVHRLNLLVLPLESVPAIDKQPDASLPVGAYYLYMPCRNAYELRRVGLLDGQPFNHFVLGARGKREAMTRLSYFIDGVGHGLRFLPLSPLKF